MIAFAAYITTIVLANWALRVFGFVPVAPGLLAPAGVYFAGAAYVLRNAIQETLGRSWSVAAIVIGAALSLLVAPGFAVASGVTFLLAEAADFLVYNQLRERRLLLAMVLACLTGDVLDSIIFLWLAFGSLDHLVGQVVGKWETVSLGVVLVWWWRARRIAVAQPQ